MSKAFLDFLFIYLFFFFEHVLSHAMYDLTSQVFVIFTL